MVKYNSDEEDDNLGIVRQNAGVFFETNNDLQNDVLTIEKRGDHRSKPREEIRVEISTHNSNRNLTKNHPLEKIIGRKDKDVMVGTKVNEEICLIYKVEPKRIDEACKDDHCIQEMKE